MAGSGWLLVELASILGAALLFGTDPDHFSAAQLLDVSGLHHEPLEVLLLVVAVIAAWAYVRANRRRDEGGMPHGPG